MWFGQSSLTTLRPARLFNPDGPVPSQSTLFSIFNPGYHVMLMGWCVCLPASITQLLHCLGTRLLSVSKKKERKKEKDPDNGFWNWFREAGLIWPWLVHKVSSNMLKGAGTEWYRKINGDTNSQCGLWVRLRRRSRISERYRVIVCLGKCQSVGKKMTYLETLTVL